MANHETIADIIAEKRRRADEIERDCAEKMKRGEMVSDCYARELVADIRQEADRLEAAHRREAGDAAKLREALELYDRLIQDRTLICDCDIVYRARTLARAALAAPTRNCDRPECATTKAAQDVWRKEDGGKTAYYEWLLAPATEKEGGAK